MSPRNRWQNQMKMDIRKLDCEVSMWMELAEDRHKVRYFVLIPQSPLFQV